MAIGAPLRTADPRLEAKPETALVRSALKQQDSNVYLGSHDSIIHALSVHTGYVTGFKISIKSILCLVSTEQKLPWSQHGKGLKSGHIETMENLFVWGGFASESAEPTRVQKSQHIKHAASVQNYTPTVYIMCIYNATASHPCTYLAYLILGMHTADTEHKLKEYLNLKT